MLSIIMATYNDDKYIGRAIDSVINQSFKDWELIIVNDGSTDNTEKILSKYKLDKIKIINKFHSGVSSSRNVGIKVANGEYITFLDSDDYVREEMYENLISNINDSDICICGYDVKTDLTCNLLEIDENNKFIDFEFSHVTPLKKTYEGMVEVGLGIRNLMNTDTLYPIWNKMYKKEIILSHNILFDENVVCWGEDELFNYEYLKYVNKMTCVDQYDIIFSTEKENALNYLYDENRFYTEKKIRKKLIELFDIKKIYDEVSERELAEVFFSKLVLLVENLKMLEFEKKIVCFEEILTDVELKYIFKHYDLVFEFLNYLEFLYSTTIISNIFKGNIIKGKNFVNSILAINCLKNGDIESAFKFMNMIENKNIFNFFKHEIK